MIREIITLSVKFRVLVVGAAVVLLAIGLVQLPASSVDGFPEFAPPQVQVQAIGAGRQAGRVEAVAGQQVGHRLGAVGLGIGAVRRQPFRQLDPDQALARADAMVQDWRGGTRIASNLAAFNRLWARRLLTGNAAMLLVTDGLLLATEPVALARARRLLGLLHPAARRTTTGS